MFLSKKIRQIIKFCYITPGSKVGYFEDNGEVRILVVVILVFGGNCYSVSDHTILLIILYT